MARLARLELPQHVHHVCVRGNNAQPIARSKDDLDVMARLWLEVSQSLNVKVHGYAFLVNSIHALVTPDKEGALSLFMQSVGRRYVQFFNRKYERTGTLWEGRFRSNVLQAEPWLLRSLVYMDGLCVTEGLPVGFDAPQEPELGPASNDATSQMRGVLYPWSSHAHWVGQRVDPLISAHESLWQLGNTPFEREVQYAEMVRVGLGFAQKKGIESSLKSGWPLGDEQFVANLQKLTPRRLKPAKVGRPRSAQK